jgi:hypothetical protein
MNPRQALKNEVFRKRQHMKEENVLYPPTLEEVKPYLLPDVQVSKKPIRVLRSRTHLAQIFDEGNGILRMTINRAWVADDGNWAEEIEWETLMRLKREAGYGDLDAVEIYPADKDVVNVAAMRHLWILPEPIPYAWRSQRQKAESTQASNTARLNAQTV